MHIYFLFQITTLKTVSVLCDFLWTNNKSAIEKSARFNKNWTKHAGQAGIKEEGSMTS